MGHLCEAILQNTIPKSMIKVIAHQFLIQLHQVLRRPRVKSSLPNIKMENQVSSSTHQHLNIDTIRDLVVEAESDISEYASRIAFLTSTMNHASKEEISNILDKMETAKNLLLELFFDVEVLREKNGEPDV